MNFQLINHQSWQPSTVIPSTCVARAYGFDMRDVFALPSLHAAGTTTKHRAAAAKATVKGPRPWSPPVT